MEWQAGNSLRAKMKWRLLLPGASEPRLKGANPSGLDFRYPDRLRGEGDRSIVVVGNYSFGPITAEPCRAKAQPLRPRRSCFAPSISHRLRWFMVEAPGTAPGSDGFITLPVYRHSRIAPAGWNIGTSGMGEKVPAPNVLDCRTHSVRLPMKFQASAAKAKTFSEGMLRRNMRRV